MLHFIFTVILFSTLVVYVIAGKTLTVTLTPDDNGSPAAFLSKLIGNSKPKTETFTDFETVYANNNRINGYIVPTDDFETKFGKMPKGKWTVIRDEEDDSLKDTIQDAVVDSCSYGREKTEQDGSNIGFGKFTWAGRHSGECILNSGAEDYRGKQYTFLFDKPKLIENLRNRSLA